MTLPGMVAAPATEVEPTAVEARLNEIPASNRTCRKPTRKSRPPGTKVPSGDRLGNKKRGQPMIGRAVRLAGSLYRCGGAYVIGPVSPRSRCILQACPPFFLARSSGFVDIPNGYRILK